MLGKAFLNLINREKNCLIIILAVFLYLAWVSWSKAGDLLTLDNSREVLVPYLLTQGKLLYRDIYYFYGPLPPYILALMVKITGLHLQWFYLFSLSIILGYAYALYGISRFILDKFFSTIVALLFLSQLAFQNTESLSYVLPYAYAALFGSFSLIVLVLLLLMHHKTDNKSFLFTAIGVCVICFFIKQDYAISCTATVAFYQFLAAYSARKKLDFFYLLILLPRLFLLLASIGLGFGLLFALFSLIFGFQNFVEGMFPFYVLDTALSKLLVSITRADFTFENLLYASLHAFGAIYIISILFLLIKFKKEVLEHKNYKLIPVLFFLILLGITYFFVNDPLFPGNKILWLTSILKNAYVGINLWIIAMLIFSLTKLKDPYYQRLTLISIAALSVTYRMFFNLSFVLYSYYLLPLCIVLFVYVIASFFPVFLSQFTLITKEEWNNTSKKLLIAYLILFLGLNTLIYTFKTRQFTTPFGDYSAVDDFTGKRHQLTLEVAKYISANTQPGDAILSYPISNILYLYTKRLPSSKYYYLHPGVLKTEIDENLIIKEIKANKPKFIVINNESFRIYDLKNTDSFGSQHFYPAIYDYIREHYIAEKDFSVDITPYLKTENTLMTQIYPLEFKWIFRVYKRKEGHTPAT